MNFLALSQAPPPLFSTVAIRMPAIVPTIRKPAAASALQHQADDDRERRPPGCPGTTISRSAAWVVMSTQRA